MTCNLAKHVVLRSDLPAARKFLAYRIAEIITPAHNHEMWAKSSTLAEDVGMHEGTVRKYLRMMVEDGLLVVLEDGGGRWKTTRYRFVGCECGHAEEPRPEAQKDDESADPEPLPGARYAPDTATAGALTAETAPPGASTAPPGAVEVREREKELLIEKNYQERTPSRDREISDAFDEWWKLYPRRTGKGAARKSYAKALDRTDQATLALAAAAFAALVERENREERFIPHPATWLNQERWDDELPADPAESDDPLIRYRGTSTARILSL